MDNKGKRGDALAKDPERARELGKKSARARAANKEKRQRETLSLERVESEFGVLVTLGDAQRRLERLGVWCAAGMLQSGLAGAAVRSVESWVKAHESKLTEHVVEELKSEMQRLKAELKGRPSLRVES